MQLILHLQCTSVIVFSNETILMQVKCYWSATRTGSESLLVCCYPITSDADELGPAILTLYVSHGMTSVYSCFLMAKIGVILCTYSRGIIVKYLN